MKGISKADRPGGFTVGGPDVQSRGGRVVVTVGAITVKGNLVDVESLVGGMECADGKIVVASKGGESEVCSKVGGPVVDVPTGMHCSNGTSFSLNSKQLSSSLDTALHSLQAKFLNTLPPLSFTKDSSPVWQLDTSSL